MTERRAAPMSAAAAVLVMCGSSYFATVVGIAGSILVMRLLVPSPAMRIPEQYIYCIVPVVFILFIFHMVVSLFRTLVNLQKGD